VLIRAVAAGLLATVAAAATTDRRTHVIALPPDRSLGVELTIGHLRVQGEARADAIIDITRTAPTANGLARIPVTIDETAALVRLTGTQLEGGTDPALKTDVMMRVPQGATVSARVIEGRITLSGLTGTVTADLRRGPIEATRAQGVLRLETGIGDVTASEMRLSPGGLIRLRAFNGDVRLNLAERPLDARVMALALNGTIRSDIPLTMKEARGPRWGEAMLGRGEPVISLDVVTGTIEINARR
jgi:hypothetical protein